MANIAALTQRAVLAVSGEDRVAFLQGLVSNDVTEAKAGQAVWAALLTPQGKWLADFFILSDGDRLLLDCEQALLPMIQQRLSRYRLRSRVALADSGLRVYAAWDTPPAGAGITAPEGAGITTPGGEEIPASEGLETAPPESVKIAAPDPRLPAAGWRILSATELPANADETGWDRHRLSLGLPDGSRDMETEKSILLEGGFDELHGVSWTKGCYMGQELTARTKYRGLLKRRLVPVRIAGAAPAPGTPILLDGRDVGTMRSACGERGMALLRLEAMGHVLSGDGATITPVVPLWMRLADAG